MFWRPARLTNRTCRDTEGIALVVQMTRSVSEPCLVYKPSTRTTHLTRFPARRSVPPSLFVYRKYIYWGPLRAYLPFLVLISRMPARSTGPRSSSASAPPATTRSTRSSKLAMRHPSPIEENFASPQLTNPRTQDVFQSIVKGRKSWKTLRGGEVVWPPELEAALIEGRTQPLISVSLPVSHTSP